MKVTISKVFNESVKFNEVSQKFNEYNQISPSGRLDRRQDQVSNFDVRTFTKEGLAGSSMFIIKWPISVNTMIWHENTCILCTASYQDTCYQPNVRCLFLLWSRPKFVL